MHAIYSHIAPFLAVDDAAAMLRIAESMDSFGTYADEASNDGLGEKLPQRFDAVRLSSALPAPSIPWAI